MPERTGGTALKEVDFTPNKVEGLREMLFFNKTFFRIYLIAMVSFLLVKGILRPVVLDANAIELLNIFVLSYPNFCEAIIGTLTVANMLLYIQQRWVKKERHLKKKAIYVLSTLLAAVFVLTQEFKIHNLGGENVYDPYDVLFSLIGLSVSFLLLIYVIHPTLYRENNQKRTM